MNANRTIGMLLLATMQQVSHSQEARRKVGDPVPDGATATLRITPRPGQVADSLKQLCETSLLIVEGVVSKTFPARETSPNALETDFVLTVNRVIKGAHVNQVLFSQRGGVKGDFVVAPRQYSMAQNGDRYILFLVADDRPAIPSIAGAGPRYLPTGIWSGLFRMEAGRLRAGSEEVDSLRKSYEGVPIERIIAEIQTLIRR